MIKRVMQAMQDCPLIMMRNIRPLHDGPRSPWIVTIYPSVFGQWELGAPDTLTFERFNFDTKKEAEEFVHWRNARALARAAIAAMREPTEEMWDAGRSQLSAGEGVSDIWRAMIDKALAEKKEPS